jgi:hypothetical protein
VASWFQLTLDTRAPLVEWGAVAGTTAGELLRVAYVADESGVDSAVLSLPDGRALEMAVLADRLEVALPPDTPAGTATVTALAIDDVDNAALYTLDIAVTGALVAPEAPPRTFPAAPAPLRPRPRKFITSRSRLRGSCPAQVQRAAATVRTTTAGTGSSASTTARATASSSLAASSSAPRVVRWPLRRGRRAEPQRRDVDRRRACHQGDHADVHAGDRDARPAHGGRPDRGHGAEDSRRRTPTPSARASRPRWPSGSTASPRRSRRRCTTTEPGRSCSPWSAWPRSIRAACAARRTRSSRAARSRPTGATTCSEAEQAAEKAEADKVKAEEAAEAEKAKAAKLEEKANAVTLRDERWGKLGKGFVAKLGDKTKERLREQAGSMKDDEWAGRLEELAEAYGVEATADGDDTDGDEEFSEEEVASSVAGRTGSKRNGNGEVKPAERRAVLRGLVGGGAKS